MKKTALLLCLFSIAAFTVKAQDTTKTAAPDPPLTITGSVDAYYKYDFSKHANIPTSFASDQNSVSIGMIDLGLKKKVGKASFVGELSFGPRNDQSIPNPNYHIQNLYVSYDVTSQFNLTAGYMATFVGYEVIAPTGNYNYSTSYLFTNGPFQNAGLKATYAFSDKVSLMAGVFNNYWNTYSSYRPAGEITTSGDVSTFGAQLMIAPVKGWTAYLNVLTGSYSGTEFDLTTAYQITDAFKLGLNGATFSAPHDGGGFEGVALYPQLAVSKAVSFGLRGEYFKVKKDGGDVKAITVTSNIKAGPLTLIPELRFDNKSDKFYAPFVNSNGISTNKASQFVLAAVYAF
ncbi:Putative beta-barrel porin-2, OmpL-like. bbp2 [Mucilaginibacter sp. OK268]|uniref:porin n=1 Tax=Mucilaginibacter sp. OK268 TaxID=1881048 RepID=UPI00087E69B2|nr:porin [Mucilaginibacter sp. OK268]SDP55140.1 Putative beta-barrel porin-2, OmpL-like. bbp2 [Mucilaginibacter sp. OK268]